MMPRRSLHPVALLIIGLALLVPASAGAAIKLGLFKSGLSYDQSVYNSYVTQAGRKPDIVHLYRDFNLPLLYSNEVSLLKTNGSTPLITWEPEAGVTMAKVADGTYDTRLNSAASVAKSYGSEILLRFAHEMNGDWYHWGAGAAGSGNTPADYIAAWRHIKHVFRINGVTNVKFVWSPNISSAAATRPPIQVGIYSAAQGSPSALESSTVYDQLITKIGRRPDIIHDYGNLVDPLFTSAEITNIKSHGATPMMTWQLYKSGWSGDVITLPDIAAGKYDTQLRAAAQQAKTLPSEVLIRFAHEMNGDWYPWSPGGPAGNTSAGTSYVNAWRHIVDVFRSEGASNVKFVWCPNVDYGSYPFAQYFPGDNYVDYVALDGYNWGTSGQGYNQWQSLYQVFGPSYTKITQLSSKPVMIAETSSAEVGGSKADWITQGLLTTIPNSFPRVEAVLWFDRNQELDWRVNSSSTALSAYKAAIASPIYGGSAAGAAGTVRSFGQYYPGSAYVDKLALDGYNWGTNSATGDTWRSLYTTFSPSYTNLLKLGPQPVMIAETSSSEVGGDKAAWIRDGLLTTIPNSFPRVDSVVWFSKDMRPDGLPDFRIESSSSATSAWRDVVTSPLYGGAGSTPLPNPEPTPTPDPTPTPSAGPYSLLVSVAGSGSGSVTATNINCPSTCSTSYPAGTTVTLTARPASGSGLTSWGGACSGTSSTCTVLMNEAKSVSASFWGTKTYYLRPESTITSDWLTRPTGIGAANAISDLSRDSNGDGLFTERDTPLLCGTYSDSTNTCSSGGTDLRAPSANSVADFNLSSIPLGAGETVTSATAYTYSYIGPRSALLVQAQNPTGGQSATYSASKKAMNWQWRSFVLSGLTSQAQVDGLHLRFTTKTSGSYAFQQAIVNSALVKVVTKKP